MLPFSMEYSLFLQESLRVPSSTNPIHNVHGNGWEMAAQSPQNGMPPALTHHHTPLSLFPFSYGFPPCQTHFTPYYELRLVKYLHFSVSEKNHNTNKE